MLNQLWKARNSMVFEERVLQIEEELEKVRSLFKEFWQTQIREETRTRRNEQEHPLMQNWECPPNSDLKVNVDTAIFRNFNGGVGVVVRDNWDQIMAVASWVIPYPLEPREAEAYAAFVGIKLAMECYFTNIILESDNIGSECSQKAGNLDSCFGTFIIDALDLVSNFRSVSFNHVKRGGNKIAHELA
ncbi:uncharacterized protein LOC110272089 [Arachis ipaensis]|uniref:uncharacterized protein LOC110272089 n=1 Tax=Arachis ipaensis TaxID=130454 RepID=UPI000A2B60DD|nr:uncharacterized protein LOC110272089 [Arachis ipaensis]XP_025652918.1 uncharacterized protein LOC112748886 [Arachis hypogaea]